MENTKLRYGSDLWEVVDGVPREGWVLQSRRSWL